MTEGPKPPPVTRAGGGPTGDEESESRAVRNVDVVGARTP